MTREKPRATPRPTVSRRQFCLAGAVLPAETSTTGSMSGREHLRGEHEDPVDEAGPHGRHSDCQQLYVFGSSVPARRGVAGVPSAVLDGTRPRVDTAQLQRVQHGISQLYQVRR